MMNEIVESLSRDRNHRVRRRGLWSLEDVAMTTLKSLLEKFRAAQKTNS